MSRISQGGGPGLITHVAVQQKNTVKKCKPKGRHGPKLPPNMSLIIYPYIVSATEQDNIISQYYYIFPCTKNHQV